MAVPQHMTAASFWMQYAYQPYELIAGRVVRVKTLGFRYAVPLLRLNDLLERFVAHHNLGEVVGPHCGFRLEENSIRTPRNAFITQSKYDAIEFPYNYLPFAPDLCIEVVMPDDSVEFTRHKIRQYLKAGTTYLWAIQPEIHQIAVFHRSGKTRSFKISETIQGGEILPGFELPLRHMFPNSRKR